MQASKVTRAVLEKAMAEVGVTGEIESLNAKNSRFRIKLFPVREVGGVKYQRMSHSGRKVFAVCWHGFRDFFRAVYKLEPDAEFRTSIATWKGSGDFEARYMDSGDTNIGSNMKPLDYAGACFCRGE